MIDIRANARKHEGIVKVLPAALALSGCDTGAQLWGTAVKALETGHYIQKLGDANMWWMVRALYFSLHVTATSKHTACQTFAETYGQTYGEGKGNSNVRPEGAATYHRSRRTKCSTRSYSDSNLEVGCQIGTADFGRSMAGLATKHLKTLIPIMLMRRVALAPSEIMKLIRCGRSSDKPCYTAQ